MHRRFFAVLLALSAAAHAQAQAPSQPQGARSTTAPKPLSATPAATRDSLRRTLQQILDHAVADSAFPGAIAVIGTHAGPLATVTSGHLDWARSPAPDEHTLWDLASLTKVVGMTSAMMQLVEQKKVDLDAPVQRYLPEWTGTNKEKVTVRHLITHQSGLPAFKQYFKLNVSPDSTWKLFLATPLDTLPGVKMVYSDIGAMLLGHIIERVSGETLDHYLTKHVFRPLGMNETMYRPAVSLRKRIAPTENDPWRGRHLVGEVHDENAFALGGVSAHAGIFSSAHDLTRLARAYLNGGALDGARLAKASTIQQFTTVADSTFSSRALGWDTPPGAGSGHLLRHPAFGHTGFTGTSLWIAPQYDMYVLLLTNRVNPTREHSKIAPVRTAVADAAMRLLEPAAVAALEATMPATPSSSGRP